MYLCKTLSQCFYPQRCMKPTQVSVPLDFFFSPLLPVIVINIIVYFILAIYSRHISIVLKFKHLLSSINVSFSCLSFFHNSCICFVHCLECTSGAFKSTISNTKCVQCPPNSVSNAERTACTCEEAFYRLPDVEDCKGMYHFSHTTLTVSCLMP